MAAEKVVKLIGEKRATLVGWPVLTTKSGMRAVVEEIHEFRYATEFEDARRTHAGARPSG
jgi:hypothetical protein